MRVSRKTRAQAGASRGMQWLLALALAACGGTGNEADSGPAKTYLSVEASDPEGGTLHYQWRVTGGTVENRDAAQTVWTLPDGPGLHFAYVRVSDGRGGWAEQQYAVSSDTLNTPVPVRAPLSYTPPLPDDADGAALRLRVRPGSESGFAATANAAAGRRVIYQAGVRLQVTHTASGTVLWSGRSDSAGEASLPRLKVGETYDVSCATRDEAPLVSCGTLVGAAAASRRTVFTPDPDAAQNLRLYGHVALADGSACGTDDEFFGLQSAATVQLLSAAGTALSRPFTVNRYGDYRLDAAVPVKGALKLKVQCEGYSATLDVPASPDAAGYVSTAEVELSHAIPNQRPRIVKMVANGPDGNVRGKMVEPLPNADSNATPGANHYLVYKGKDTKLSSCLYYRALGAVKDCDAQGNMIQPITFDDWKRSHKLSPYAAGNTEVSADYINKMDLNLVRRMAATKLADDHIAFSVCNHPGPDGTSQAEVDAVMDAAFDGQRNVACVTMEWTTTPGVNGGRPFTKFFTFAPDGSLLPSVNLDGRGEKYLPGACVACHGGNQYNGAFPSKGSPSPYLGASFLPFDTNNYFFSSRAGKSEAAQGAQFHALNQLVRATEGGATTAITSLIDGWYAAGGTTLDKNYVPDAWRRAEAASPGASRFYHEVVGASCRTCHVSMSAQFNWDINVLSAGVAQAAVCGGTSDVAINASMPNALISRDRVAEKLRSDPSLARLAKDFLGCTAPQPDPVYPKR